MEGMIALPPRRPCKRLTPAVQTKYKQSKAEANTAQNILQKEITSLRDTNRTIQSKLLDIEVSNDNFERQARNTTSSLEDLESKYNVAIERGVLADEEIRAGDQERETLRIETQRLRDELSDLRIEADIRQDKLRKAEVAVKRLHLRKPSPINSELIRPQSALSELSPTTSSSSPTIATPPTKSASSVSETPTPPSPPTSDKSNSVVNPTPTIPLAKSRLSTTDSNVTPRPLHLSSRPPKRSRRPSIPISSERTPHAARRTTLSRPDTVQRQGLPHSGSLHHLHGLMSKMQLLEQRVHSVRSKLPAPTSTPPRASPRSMSALGDSHIPATVTMRSNRKRTGGSNVSSTNTPTGRPSSRLSSTYTYGTERPSSRLSFGVPQPSPTRDSNLNRPPSRDTLSQRSPSRDPHDSRPSSRASFSSRQSASYLPNASTSSTSRPGSRQSISNTRTPISHHATNSQSESRRPRSSMGGFYASTHSGHGHSASVSKISNYGSQRQCADEEDSHEALTPTPSRQAKAEPGSSLPALASGSLRSRPSGFSVGKRTSSGAGDMAPPERKITRKLSEVGESY